MFCPWLRVLSLDVFFSLVVCFVPGYVLSLVLFFPWLCFVPGYMFYPWLCVLSLDVCVSSVPPEPEGLRANPAELCLPVGTLQNPRRCSQDKPRSGFGSPAEGWAQLEDDLGLRPAGTRSRCSGSRLLPLP